MKDMLMLVVAQKVVICENHSTQAFALLLLLKNLRNGQDQWIDERRKKQTFRAAADDGTKVNGFQSYTAKNIYPDFKL